MTVAECDAFAALTERQQNLGLSVDSVTQNIGEAICELAIVHVCHRNSRVRLCQCFVVLRSLAISIVDNCFRWSTRLFKQADHRINLRARQSLAEAYLEQRRLNEGIQMHLDLLEDVFNGTTSSIWRPEGTKASPPREVAFQVVQAPLLGLIQQGDNPKALQTAGWMLGWDGVSEPSTIGQPLEIRQYLVELGRLPATQFTTDEARLQASSSFTMDAKMKAATDRKALEVLDGAEIVLPLILLRLFQYEAAIQGFIRLWLKNQSSALAIALIQATMRNACQEAEACQELRSAPLRDLNPFRDAQDHMDLVHEAVESLRRHDFIAAEKPDPSTVGEMVETVTIAYNAIVGSAQLQFSSFDFSDMPVHQGPLPEPHFEEAGHRPIERLSEWTPTVLTKMPSALEIFAFARRREPFIIRLDPSNATHYSDNGGDGNSGPIANVSPCGNRAFDEVGWDVCKWDAEYLCNVSGDEMASLATSVAGKFGVFAVSIRWMAWCPI